MKLEDKVRKILVKAERSGTSEGRAVSETILDALECNDFVDPAAAAVDMLDEFEAWAKSLRNQIFKAQQGTRK